jgi:hypothetical protein
VTNILIQEVGPLLLSSFAFIGAFLLIALKTITFEQGLLILTPFIVYWVGNGTSRLVSSASVQVLNTPPVTQLADAVSHAPAPTGPLVVIHSTAPDAVSVDTTPPSDLPAIPV